MSDNKFLFSKYRKTIYMFIILLISFITINSCYGNRFDEFYRNLNEIGKEISIFVKNFNMLKYDSSKIDIINDFDSMKTINSTIIINFQNIENKVSKDIQNFFKSKYIPSFEDLENTFKKLINSDYSSERLFVDKYNNVSKSINHFIEDHNTLVSMLETSI